MNFPPSNSRQDISQPQHHYSEKLISDHLLEENNLLSLRFQLKKDQIVCIQNFFDEEVFSDLNNEIEKLVRLAVRKDFIMKEYDTPRNMFVVGGRTILRQSWKLAALYSAHSVVSFLSKVVGQNLHLNGQPDAFMAINCLKHDGDTQGWHLDDGSHAVVYCFSSPQLNGGGNLEYIRNWPSLMAELTNSDPPSVAAGLETAKERGLLSTLRLQPNSMYILRSNTTLHRVAPLRQPSRSRTVLAAGYEVERVKAYSHTGADLYSGA